MITGFRNFAKSKWAIGLLVVLALSLLITGGTQMDVFANLGPKHVITAGERSVNAAEFRAEFERFRAAQAEETGQPVSFQDLVDANTHVRYLEQQTTRRGFMGWAWEAGIRPGQDLVIKEIRKIPAFFSQVTGQFDEPTYLRLLAEQNLTPAQLEAEFRDQYAAGHFASASVAGLRLPRIYGALLAGTALETRDGRWFSVTQAMAGTTGAPTDAQLTAFLNENAARLRQPEYRQTSVVLFDDAPGSTPPPVDEAKIVERFEFRKDALSTPETRTFVTLTAPTREVATRIAAALRAGQTPEQAGQANGNIRPASFDSAPRTAVTDPAVAAAVFGLPAGQVSDPVQARIGFTVARVTAINPGAPATLASVREALIAELREEDAKTRAFARVTAYEKARGEGKTLAQAVSETGARIIQLPPFTQDGKLPDGQAMNAPPQIIQTAWTLSKGGESDLIDAGQGQYFVLRLDDIRAAALPTLAEVREPLTQAWIQRENTRRLTTRAEALAARVRGGEDIAAVAASVGATVQTRTGVEQNEAAQTEVGQGVLRGLFGQGPGDTFVGPQTQDSYVVGRVDAVKAADPARAAPIAEQARLQMTQQMSGGLVEAAAIAGSARIKAKNDPAEALRALGVTATAPAAPGGTPTAPAGS